VRVQIQVPRRNGQGENRQKAKLQNKETYTFTLAQIPCPPGSFSSSPSQSTCTSCEAGTFQSDEAKDACSPCTFGHYCPASSIAPLPCLSGSTFQPDASQTLCKSCSNCPLGEVMTADCTITTDRQCSPCVAPTYSNDGTACNQCDGEGKYNDEDGAAFCKTAKAGYKPKENRKGEEICPAGTYSTGGADECSDCGDGETSGAGAAGCSTCASCATGKYMIKACTPTSETECGDCLAGTVSTGGAVTECTSCTADGEYSDTDLAR
jgi:hypothetical protein